MPAASNPNTTHSPPGSTCHWGAGYSLARLNFAPPPRLLNSHQLGHTIRHARGPAVLKKRSMAAIVGSGLFGGAGGLGVLPQTFGAWQF